MGAPVIAEIIARLLAQASSQKSVADSLQPYFTLLAAGLGLVGTYLGLTSNARNQRLAIDKAEQEELDRAKGRVRQLETELQDMKEREWEARKQSTDDRARLKRVEEDLVEERRTTSELRREVEELRSGR